MCVNILTHALPGLCMISPPTPHNESERLAALIDYQVLDTPAEPRFDELTELVSRMLEVPIALVSLVDDKRQWFKSHHGLSATETPREVAFCAHAILGDELFVVEDSHADQRFYDNPLVTEAPHVRFYAGMPLITESGFRIGTLCGIDHEPRTLTEAQKRILEIVSRQVIDQLELSKSLATKNRLLQQQQRLVEQLESANQEVRDFVSVVAHDLRAPILNTAGFAAEILQKTEALAETRDDSTELAEVCNDIQTAGRFIQRSAEQMDERISAITSLTRLGHRALEFEQLDLHQLVSEVCELHRLSLRDIGGTVHISQLPELESDRLATQLVVENLVANAIKYRQQDRPLTIRVWADSDADGVTLHVQDNGRGITDTDLTRIFVMFRRVGEQNTSGDGTGLAFSRAIVNRLGGRIWCDSQLAEGSTFHVYFPAGSQLSADNSVSSS